MLPVRGCLGAQGGLGAGCGQAPRSLSQGVQGSTARQQVDKPKQTTWRISERERWCELWTRLFHSYCLVCMDQKPQINSAEKPVCVSHTFLWRWVPCTGSIWGETCTSTVQEIREQGRLGTHRFKDGSDRQKTVMWKGKSWRSFLLWALSEPASLAHLRVPKWLCSWISHGDWGTPLR